MSERIWERFDWSDEAMVLVARADAFASAAFQAQNQRRKYSDEPYMVHCREVADLVFYTGATAEMVAAALLHDVVEDTPITLETIYCEFGAAVEQLVREVTDVSRPEDGNRAARKALDCAHLAQASANGQTIKLADLISNTSSIVERDPKFARVYLAEKAELLKVLTRGDEVLFRRASKQVGA